MHHVKTDMMVDHLNNIIMMDHFKNFIMMDHLKTGITMAHLKLSSFRGRSQMRRRSLTMDGRMPTYTPIARQV